MKYPGLKAEIEGDAKYRGLEDVEIATLLNSKITGAKSSAPIKTRRALVHLIDKGLWQKLRESAKTNAVARNLIEILSPKNFEETDLNGAEISRIISSLPTSVMNNAQKTGLKNLSDVIVSRGEQLYGVGANIHHLNIAQALRPRVRTKGGIPI